MNNVGEPDRVGEPDPVVVPTIYKRVYTVDINWISLV